MVVMTQLDDDYLLLYLSEGLRSPLVLLANEGCLLCFYQNQYRLNHLRRI